jgi:MarR family transcriptional regulator, 2-MHQ and catechol-resistance regulon repressor
MAASREDKPKIEKASRDWPINTYLAIIQAGITGEKWINTFHRQYQLRQPATAIISLLYSNNGSLQQQKLVRLLRRTRQAITRALDNLEKRGLITRSACKYERRMKTIGLTDEGSKLAGRIKSEENRFNKIITDAISEKEGNQLALLLRTFENSLSADLKTRASNKAKNTPNRKRKSPSR